MITIQNLSFQYKKQDALFTDLTFVQKSGSIVGLLGKNGAGKSTLLGLIAGLLRPQIGTLNINGFKPFDRLPNFLADIYMVSEEFSFPSITIQLYIKATAPLYPKFDYVKMNNILQEFELDFKKFFSMSLRYLSGFTKFLFSKWASPSGVPSLHAHSKGV